MVRTNISQIRDAMAARSLNPRSRWGQNFLKERGILELIVREGEVEPGDLVVEIGSGPGCLTEELERAGARILAVEIDAELQQVAHDLLGERDAIRWVQADILAGKSSLNPAIIDSIEEELAATGRSSFKLIANLPYNVAVPVVVNFLESVPACRAQVVMVQDELADRFLAEPGSTDYGLVSVLIASRAHTRRVRRVGAAAFWPSPKVGSSIVKIVPFDTIPFSKVPYEEFKAVARGMFSHRRKKWIKSLLSAAGISKKGIFEKKLADLGFDTDLRAESLAPDDILNIAVALNGMGYSALEEGRRGRDAQSASSRRVRRRPGRGRSGGQKKL